MQRCIERNGNLKLAMVRLETELVFVLGSDGTLNPNGVRFGSSEIYNIGEPLTGLRKDRLGALMRTVMNSPHKCSYPSIHFNLQLCYVLLLFVAVDAAIFCFSSLKFVKCSFLPISSITFCFLLLLFSPFPHSLFTPLIPAVEAYEEVSDSLCVPQYNADGEERVILFLKMAPGQLFGPELVQRIRGAIRKALSARHVPALLLETKDIPVREK